MKDFWIKTANWIFVLLILFGYNQILQNRNQKDALQQMQEKAETAESQLEQYRSAFRSAEKKQAQKANTKTKDAATKVDEAEANDSAVYQDGTYEGTSKGFGGDIRVQVTIEKDTITEIQILEANGEDNAYLEMASNIISDILEQQTAEVDTVSGATFSSTGIREATKAALEQAVNDT